jgi:hypothetical protein
MNNIVDVLAISEEIEKDSQSGALCRELLAKGETLYGVSQDFPDYIECRTPDGRVSLGCLRDGLFEVKISLLNGFSHN